MEICISIFSCKIGSRRVEACFRLAKLGGGGACAAAALPAHA